MKTPTALRLPCFHFHPMNSPLNYPYHHQFYPPSTTTMKRAMGPKDLKNRTPYKMGYLQSATIFFLTVRKKLYTVDPIIPWLFNSGESETVLTFSTCSRPLILDYTLNSVIVNACLTINQG